jgi:nucleoside-diphosphate-sugar epimerase
MATIMITGATGVLGRHAVARLQHEGHRVRGLARNAERAAAVAALGAEPVVGDIYSRADMERAMTGVDAGFHLATRIPPVAQSRKPAAWAENTKLRAVGTKVLVDAALACGVERFVAESIVLIYPDSGARWIDETTPVDASPALESVVQLEAEVARFAAQGGVGVSLRFGMFYGPDARSTDEFVEAAAHKIAPAIGKARGYVSSIHTFDAAEAVVAALGAPSGSFNVVDDVPLTRREIADAFAHAFGSPHLRIVPSPVIKAAGGASAQALLRSLRVRNDAFAQATGWKPTIPSAVEGWAAIAAERGVLSHA